MSPLLVILAIASVALPTLLFAVAWLFSSLVIRPRTQPTAESYAEESAKPSFPAAKIAFWETRPLRIKSPHGYPLEASWFPVAGSASVVILAHGITRTRYGSYKYIEAFRSLGFSCLVPDHRNHGESGGKNTTFGFYEKDDMRAWVDWVVTEAGEGATIGTHGESMGAAIALQHAAVDPRISFVVADSAFSDLRKQIEYRLAADWRLPPFPIIWITDAVCGIRTGGMRFALVSPAEAARKIAAPVLVIHGSDDDYVPMRMARAIFDARWAAGRRCDLWIAPGATHAQAIDTHGEEYARRIAEFIASVRAVR